MIIFRLIAQHVSFKDIKRCFLSVYLAAFFFRFVKKAEIQKEFQKNKNCVIRLCPDSAYSKYIHYMKHFMFRKIKKVGSGKQYLG